jgi:hypothetical protein
VLSALASSTLMNKKISSNLSHICICRNSLATSILQRLPFSSDSHSPASPPILQQLPFSSASHSPAHTILQRLLHRATILQRLPFSSDYHSLAPSFLQRLARGGSGQNKPFLGTFFSQKPFLSRNLSLLESFF